MTEGKGEKVTGWKSRFIIVISALQSSAAAIKAKDWDPDKGGDKTFSVRLSANGKEPATHLACETALTDAMLAKVLAATTAVGTMQVFNCQDWTFDEVLAHLKLKRIETNEGAGAGK